MAISVRSAENNSIQSGGGIKRVKIKGGGFLYENGSKHDWELHVVVLNQAGNDIESPDIIEVMDIDQDEVTDNDFFVNIRVKDSKSGPRTIIVKEISEKLNGGSCVNNTKCDSLNGGIVVT